MSKFEGKTALITGGSSGIGLESKPGHVPISSQVFLAQWVE
jgi:short-subunit dehydrogenase involved in D-alanine esterification of teichoic acids